jgi:Zn-dependent protease with chaperone function
MHCLDWMVVVASAGLPFLAALVWGRRLSSANSQGHGPEQWLTYTRSLTTFGMMSALVAISFVPSFTLAILVLTIFGAMAGTLPARRTILGHGWELGPFLSYLLTFQIPLWGVWILLAAAPGTIVATTAWHPAFPVAFVFLLALVSHGFFRLLPRTMGASPVDVPAITARFQTVLARSKVVAGQQPPIVLRAGPRGGVWVEALALPDRGRPGILVADSLLEKLDLDELGALFAHRIARLEEYQLRPLFLTALGRWLLAAGVGILALRIQGSDPSVLTLLYMVWIVALICTLTAAIARNGRGELAADRRAVELCGDPEALVRALTKMHALANRPTRVNADLERTQAGLVSRIRAIREAAGFQAPVMNEEIVLPSSERGRFAILGPEQVCFLDQVPEGDLEASALRQRAGSSQNFAYRSLIELHLAIAIGGRATLRAATREGQQVLFPLAASSVKLAENTLDAIDAKLGRAGSSHKRATIQALLAASAVMVASFLPGISGLLVLPAFLALNRLTVGPMLGAGAAAFVAGALALVKAALGGGDRLSLLGAAAALIGGMSLVVAARRLSRSLPEGTWRNYGAAGALLSALTLLSLPFALVQALSQLPDLEGLPAGATPFAVALAVLILARYRARLSGKLAAAALLLAAALPPILGSDACQRLLGNHPYWADAPMPRLAGTEPIGRSLAIPAGLRDVHLSPTGQRFFGILADVHAPSSRDETTTFVIGDGTGETRRLSAVALAFMSDSRLLGVKKAGEELVVEEVGPEGSTPTWQARLPATRSIRLSATEARFRVIGLPPRGFDNRYLMHEGEIGRVEVVSTRSPPLPAGQYRTDWIPTVAGEASVSLVVLPSRERSFFWLGGGPRTLVQLESPGAPARTVLETAGRVSCPDVPLGSKVVYCVVTTHGRSAVVAIARGWDRAMPKVRLPFRYSAQVERAGDALGIQSEDEHLLIQPEQGRGFLLRQAEEPTPGQLALGEHAVALVPYVSEAPTPTMVYPH